MPVEIAWLGHNCWSIKSGQHTLLVDPFLNDSPTAPVKAEEVSADFVLVSHGHFDHVADCAAIARRTGATVISNFEICDWLGKQGVENTVGHNLGGGSTQPFGRVKMTLAHHSSVLPDGTYGGSAGGFLLWFSGATLYLACDTSLFYDMKLIGTAGIDLAMLPIGDLFTMGPEDSIQAIKLLEPKRAVPCHYNTWPPIEQDAEAWAQKVKSETEAEPTVLNPGEKTML